MNRLLRSIEASRERPFGVVLFATRDRGRRLRHRPQPRAAVPHGRRAAGRHARADRRDARNRPEGRRADPLAVRRAAAGDRGPARLPALRGGGAAAGRGSARGQDVRPHRHAAGPHARGGHGADHARGRQGHRQRLQEDELRRRGRVAGLQAREGRAARCSGARRGRAAGAPGRFAADRLTGGAGHGRRSFHREGAFRTCHISSAPQPRWQSSRWSRRPARSRPRSRSTRRPYARSPRCPRARRRT